MTQRNANSPAAVGVVTRIVSGGQTGVDRAALDAGLAAGIAIGGWCPRGRRSEAGLIPAHYPLQETGARNYAVRTAWNVRDSDGTLVIVLDEISSGTKLTLEAARSQGKPVKVVHLRPTDTPGLFTTDHSLSDQVESVVEWLRVGTIRVLNVAGPRGSSHEDIYSEALKFMSLLLKQILNRDSTS
ncbi:MAG TPA: molybdenum cofactor carrier [Planctomycetes bacterium]|nr:molybdenum cofactor carrier [Fuerstiella sp.]HIK94253.1 molybdenum cofactor carrier [Planctomycetota bacterium]